MEDNNIRIINLIHDITQLDYQVRFCRDFNSMLRIEYLHEYNEAYYHHEHRGTPDGTRNQLEKEIIKSLQTFLDNAEAHEDDKQQ
jgi:hypothetical protein